MDSPGGKGGRCVRLTTYHPCSAGRQEIRGLNPLNAELNLICHLLALLGGATIVVFSRLRVNLPGPPWAISMACCGRDLYLYPYYEIEVTKQQKVSYFEINKV